MNNIKNILVNFDINKCCGCSSCVAACPKTALRLGKDEYGFLKPVIDTDKCINCGLCVESCPYHGEVSYNNPLYSYAAISKDRSVVKTSSSGGIFYQLAKSVISNGGVVCGATMDSSFQIRHIIISKEEEIRLLQKSKYVQSNLGNSFVEIKKYLRNNKKVLFSGTPCQVTALKTFLRKEDCSNLLLVDIVCHGVPSQVLFDDYLECLQKRVGKIEKYEFRSKKSDRNGMNWFFSYKPINKRLKIKNWPEDSYNYFYMMGMVYRDSCYSCKFAKAQRVSDITLCDYWSWDNYHEKDFQSSSSVSGMILNTEKGQMMMDNCFDELKLVETKYDDIVRHNKCLNSPTEKNVGRDKLLNDWIANGYESLDKTFRRKHFKSIIKYSILRHLPESLRWKLTRKSR